MNLAKYSLSDLPYNKKEILRYASSKENDDILDLINECINEIDHKLKFLICYKETSVFIKGNTIDLEFTTVKSDDLITNMQNCHKCIVFVATIGIEIDRLINKYSTISPSKALIFQAIGAERIESLCNKFSYDIKEKYLKENLKTCPRFSPGYGDLPLDIQKDIFSTLNCSKHIGVMLNNSMLISPSKSVTALIGIYDERN